MSERVRPVVVRGHVGRMTKRINPRPTKLQCCRHIIGCDRICHRCPEGLSACQSVKFVCWLFYARCDLQELLSAGAALASN